MFSMISLLTATNLVHSSSKDYNEDYYIYAKNEEDDAGEIFVVDRVVGKVYATKYSFVMIGSERELFFDHVVEQDDEKFVLFHRAKYLPRPTNV